MLQLFELNRVLLNFIAKAPKVPEWVEIHALADKAEPVIENLFMDSILRLKMQMNLNKVSEAFSTNSIGEVEKTIPWEVFDIKFAEIQEIIYNLLVGGGSIAALEFWQQTGRFMKADDGGPSMEFSFNVRSPHAIKWAADHSSELIREVSDETRAGVRSIISEAFTSGGHPYETARQIREMVGLTDRQMGSVRSLRERLRAAKATDIDKKVERYTKKRINQRAKLIARTETIRSACEGQQTHWNDMIQKGYLDKDEMVKEWIVTPDDRLCARCNELDGKQAPIDGDFAEVSAGTITSPEEPEVAQPDSIMRPHPDTTKLEGMSGYKLFQDEAEKWTHGVDLEGRQNAYDYATRDKPELGQALRDTYLTQSEGEVTVYRVGGTQDGINSFFGSKGAAIGYAGRFGDSIDEYTFNAKHLIPSETGAGEIWAEKENVIKKKPMKMSLVVGEIEVPEYEMNYGFNDRELLELFPTRKVLDDLVDWKNDSGTSDLIQKAMNKALGTDRLPEIISVTKSIEMENAGGVRLFRGVKGLNDAQTKVFVEDFKRGEFYAGIGQSGNGTYATAAKEKAFLYSGGDKEGVIEMMLRPEAMVIDDDKLETLFESKRKALREKSLTGILDDDGEILMEVYTDSGRFALSQGFDAIKVNAFSRKPDYIILNRTAVGVLEASPELEEDYDWHK